VLSLQTLKNPENQVEHFCFLLIGYTETSERCLKMRKSFLERCQEKPDTLMAARVDKPNQILHTASKSCSLSGISLLNTRLPSGHPEGFIEAFADIYRNFALTLKCRIEGVKPKVEYLDFPGVNEGVSGMAFIETVIENHKSGEKWTPLKK